MSTVITDNLTGKTSAGSVTITSEGGSATMQLQQGVAKAWAKFDNSATLADSFNISSTVDVLTGQWRFSKTNSMASTDYTVVGTNGYTIGNFNTGHNTNAIESSANHTQSKFGAGWEDLVALGGYGMHNVHGDLA